MDVLIRDLPEGVHAELVRRAAAKDMSLRAYLREVLSEHCALPSMSTWLQQVQALGPLPRGIPTGPDLIAAERSEADEVVDR